MAGRWPFAHVPEHFGDVCTRCGRRDEVVVVMADDDDSPPGAFELLCWSCLGRDGDPLHRTR